MASPLRSNNAAGIWFWLRWILTCIAGFTVSFVFWDWLLLVKLGGDIKKPGVAIGWMVAVFGTWFITLIPLMAKKEKVMGHMDKQDESTVSWWLIWISLTIGSFFAAVWFWTPFIARHFGSIKNPGVSLLWIIAVFGSWLVALIPLMVFMYSKVDKAYEEARIKREMRREKFKDTVKIKALLIPGEKRRIPPELAKSLKEIPETIKGGHLLHVRLKDGRRVENVFVSGGSEVLGVYDQDEFTFKGSDIIGYEPADLLHPPDFTAKRWLRLDGNSA